MTTTEALLAVSEGLLVRSDLSPAQTAVVDGALRHGRLVTVLPGIYTSPGHEHDETIRLRAAMARFPGGVACRGTAAARQFWPGYPDERVHVAGVRVRHPRPGFCFTRDRVHAEWIIRSSGLRLTAPALTAIDLADVTNGESIDRALRSRQATLPAMTAALRAHPNRSGNDERQRLLLDSRDEPWSTAERVAHRLLRRHHIEGWRANVALRVGRRCYFPDLVFPAAKLCAEIDGRALHDSPSAFEDDHRRQNEIQLAGWLMLRFTWTMLTESPDEVVASLRRGLASGPGRRRF